MLGGWKSHFLWPVSFHESQPATVSWHPAKAEEMLTFLLLSWRASMIWLLSCCSPGGPQWFGCCPAASLESLNGLSVFSWQADSQWPGCTSQPLALKTYRPVGSPPGESQWPSCASQPPSLRGMLFYKRCQCPATHQESRAPSCSSIESLCIVPLMHLLASSQLKQESRAH